MARHRNVRGYNYDEDFDDDDMYGHSMEDDYCISPATAAQFIYSKRNRHSSFTEPLEEEDECEEEELDKARASHIALSSVDQARLFSSLEHMREVLGESVSEQVMIDAILKCQFDVAKALDLVFKTDCKMAAKPGSNDMSSTGRPAKEAIFPSLQSFDATVKTQSLASINHSDDKNVYSDIPATMSLSALLSKSPQSSTSANATSLSKISLSDLIAQPSVSDASDLSGTDLWELSRSKHLSQDAGLKDLQLDPLRSRHLKQPNLNDLVSREAASGLDNFQAFSISKHLNPENHVLSGNLFGSLSSVLYSEDSLSSDGENLSVPKYGSPSLADLIQEHKEKNDFQDLSLESPRKIPCKTEDKTSSHLPLSQLSELSNTFFDFPSLTSSLSSLAVSQPSALAEPQISLSDLIGEAEKPVFDSLNLFQSNLTETDTSIDLRFLINKPAHIDHQNPNKKSSEAIKKRKNRSHWVKTLKAKPSAFALSLCFTYIPKSCRKNVLLPHQNHKLSPPSEMSDAGYPALIPFDFQTPSPDDVVKESQKKAFMR